jgi:hypothetical protein
MYFLTKQFRKNPDRKYVKYDADVHHANKLYQLIISADQSITKKQRLSSLHQHTSTYIPSRGFEYQSVRVVPRLPCAIVRGHCFSLNTSRSLGHNMMCIDTGSPQLGAFSLNSSLYGTGKYGCDYKTQLSKDERRRVKEDMRKLVYRKSIHDDVDDQVVPLPCTHKNTLVHSLGT